MGLSTLLHFSTTIPYSYHYDVNQDRGKQNKHISVTMSIQIVHQRRCSFANSLCISAPRLVSLLETAPPASARGDDRKTVGCSALRLLLMPLLRSLLCCAGQDTSVLLTLLNSVLGAAGIDRGCRFRYKMPHLGFRPSRPRNPSRSSTSCMFWISKCACPFFTAASSPLAPILLSRIYCK